MCKLTKKICPSRGVVGLSEFRGRICQGGRGKFWGVETLIGTILCDI